MRTGQPAEHESSQTALREVLGLGEDLLCLAQDAVTDGASASETFSSQCELVIQTATRLVGGQVDLWLSEQVLDSFIGKVQGRPVNGESASPPTPLMRFCLETLQVCGAPRSNSNAFFDISEQIGAQKSGVLKTAAKKAHLLAAPLLVQDRAGQTTALLGVLQADRSAGTAFTISEIRLLEGLATQSALALQSSLRMANERWRREQLSLVHQVSLQIAELRDLDEIARQVTRLILQTFDFYFVAIFTLPTGEDVLHFRASAGPGSLSDPDLGGRSLALAIHLGQGIIGHVAQTGQEFLARDVRQESLYRYYDLLPETRSEATLPLTVQDRLLGVLDVQSDQLDDFDESDMMVLRSLAGNIAMAIEDAQLYKALRHHASQLEAVYEVSSAITSILDQDKLLNEVVELIHKRFDYPYIHLFTVHPGRGKIFYEAGSGPRSQVIHKEDYFYELDDPQGIIPWVARNGETVLANDVRHEPRFRPSKLPPDETLSELSVPLIFGGQVLGVLDVQSDKLNAFGEEERFLFTALAEHIAIAMRNANLYRSETWRRRVADSLREVAGLLSADLDLDQVLEAVLTELEHTLPLDVAAIWLLSESSSDEDSSELPDLHLAAVRGAGTFDLELEIGLLPEEVLEYNLDTPDEQKLAQACVWLNEALRSDLPVTRSPGSSFDPLGAALGFPPNYSAIAAPLRVGERLLGVLTLAHRTAGRYGSESQTMTAAFASYASVALENARLYEDAHEQAWVSTVLLQVAEATQSVTNLTELLDTVIRITPMLTGVRACLIYILDEDGTFVPAAASGLSPDQQAEFERWRFAPGDVTALDRLMEDRSPVILHEGQADNRLLSILSTAQTKENSKEVRLPVLVPLLARGEVLGVFMVDYSTGLPTMEMGKSLEAFFDERLAILQGIAHQTAGAVDNIRLLKAQKEEAYVSVALLQVAQAVVSSNDLEEALGSIVRITPILVGVNRAIIYLWDEQQHSFHMSQAYGIARSAGGQTYAGQSFDGQTYAGQIFAYGEFPLLDAALLADSLVACPLQYGESDEDVLGAWTRLEAPDLERVDEYLEEAASLLIAFPLAMKGKVLGIFLVEEPEPVPGEPSSSGNANRRLRSKRLEIITGISQQAALAIQNDLLQREMVERERLEREMQLAREIQRAFLPHSLPKLPGWDMQVNWRPARQVGGDFYDFFELPDGRFGLVIADVADKGMPAALFMTLVRTLVRATVRDLASPAAVLRRVNNLIVPDATGGMFVTLAYAVLDLKTGELTIANAGHNPPLWLRCKGCQLEDIQRTGMALGVLEDNPFEERTCKIGKGDFLILYTDGVTDAFSPEGHDFGDQRLRQAIGDACQSTTIPDGPASLTAQQMLDAIDQQVVAFVADGVPSDDLTLLVLKRLPAIKKDRRTWGGHARQSKEGHRKHNTGDVLIAQTGD